MDINKTLSDAGIKVFTETLRIRKNTGSPLSVAVTVKNFVKLYDVILKNKKICSVLYTDQLTAYLKNSEIFKGDPENFISSIESIPFKYTVPHTYLIKYENNTIIIDPACRYERLKEMTSSPEVKDDALIICTHHHPDHWGNAGLLERGSMKLFFHHDVETIFAPGFFRYHFEQYMRTIQTLDAVKVFPRVLGLHGLKKAAARMFIKYMPRLTSLGLYFITSKIYGRASLGRNIHYLADGESKEYIFGSSSLKGWQLSDHVILLNTQGHSDDMLTVLLKDKQALMISDCDVFLNPVNDIDGTIKKVHENNIRLIDIVRHEKIKILLPSHTDPILGHEKILIHLETYDQMLYQVEDIMKNIIYSRDKWLFSDLAEIIWNLDDIIIRDLVKKNWPKTMSNIDLFLIMLLPEAGYHPCDRMRSQWVKILRESSVDCVSIQN